MRHHKMSNVNFVTDRTSLMAGMTFELPRDKYDEISEIAKEKKLSKAALIREVVLDFLEKKDR